MKMLTTCHTFLQGGFVGQREIAQFWIFLPLQPDLLFSLLKRSLIRGCLSTAAIQPHRRKAEGAGGKDFVDGGHGHNSKRVSVTGHYINSRPSVQAWMAFCCAFPAQSY